MLVIQNMSCKFKTVCFYLKVIRFTAQSASKTISGMRRMPEMVAPRALVFRLLVKGNEALGTRLRKYSRILPIVSLRSLHLCACLKWLLPESLGFWPLVKGYEDTGNGISRLITTVSSSKWLSDTFSFISETPELTRSSASHIDELTMTVYLTKHY